MSDQKLLEMQTKFANPQWLANQLLLARLMLNGLRVRSGLKADTRTLPVDLPEDHEILNTTIEKVLGRHDEGKPTSYAWDGTGSFDKFFARAMRRTMEALRSTERRQRKGIAKILPPRPEQATSILAEPQNIFFAVSDLSREEEIEERLHAIAVTANYESALAAAIVENRMRGKATTYIERLPKYAKLKMSKAEIARDLGVKEGTIDPYRKRTRLLLKKDPGDQ